MGKSLFIILKYPVITTLNCFRTTGCTDDKKHGNTWKSENYVVVSILSVIGFLILMGTLIDVMRRNEDVITKDNTNKKAGTVYQLITAFSLYSNLEFIFQQNNQKGTNRLDCLDGIRSISMTWVILGHNFLFGAAFLHGRNAEYINAVRSDHAGGVAFEAINKDLSVDTFLFIGSTLLSYLLMKDLDKSNGWFHAKGPLRVFLFYLNRYLRLTIPFALTIAVYIGIIPLFINQTMGARMFALQEANECSKSWWRHILYINIWPDANHSTDGCIGQTWYLAFEMEWFLASPLLIYPLWMGKFGKAQKVIGILWWTVWFLAFYHFNIIWASDPDGYQRFADKWYLPSWDFAPYGGRSHCYMLGLMMGYILHNTKNSDIKMPWLVNIAVWTVVSGVALSIIYGTYDMDTWPKYKAWLTTFRALWGLCLGWVVFACVKGYGGPINDFLSWGLWGPISKISFMTYLFHMSFNWYYFAMQDYNVDFSMWLLTETFVAQVFVALFTGLIACLTLELPFGKIQKLLLGKLMGAK